MYFSDLEEPYRSVILANRNYLRIIDHDNYSPRIIQLMTEVVRVRGISPDNYVKFFYQNLDNPLTIWEHAFEKHLSQSSRNLLIVLASLPYAVFLDDLRSLFEKYNALYAQQYGTSVGPQDLKFALRELEGAFLTYEKQEHGTVVRYHNPSVRDFTKKIFGGKSR